MKVKICGITNVQDAKLAEQLGVDYIGLNLSNYSLRQINVTTAKKICAELNYTRPIGVFVQQTPAEIKAIVQELQLSMIQVYDRLSIAATIPGVKVIQSIRVKTPADLQQIHTHDADFQLLDSYRDNAYGGTGHAFKWEYLPQDLSRIFLAGGINVTNVQQACRYQPYALDVCSGVEIEATPRQKDQAKLTAFMQEVKRYAA